MKLTFLKAAPGMRRLILIYSGWNTTPEFYRHLSRRGWDLAVVDDYTHIDRVAIPEQYTTIYLYAWSFGVAVAMRTMDTARLTAAYAICGTPAGIDDESGIPSRVFLWTSRTLSLESLMEFRRNIFNRIEGEELESLMGRLPETPDIETLREELGTIAGMCRQEPSSFPWRRIYIGTLDRIFPPANQRFGWERFNRANEERGKVSSEIVEREGGHYLPLEEILEETICDVGKLGLAFRQAEETYDSEAKAQGYFADRLAGMISGRLASEGKGVRSEERGRIGSILEVGPGSGMLSKSLFRMFPDAEATLVDLYRSSLPGLWEKQERIVGNAEEYLPSLDREWDLIASSSAIQWFSDPEEFFRQSGRVLSPDGVVAFCILSRGNLRELDELRTSPIHYFSMEELGEMAGRHLEIERLESEERVVEFPRVRDLLIHIRHTGTYAGVRSSLRECLHRLSDRRLTYCATFIIARKKKS